MVLGLCRRARSAVLIRHHLVPLHHHRLRQRCDPTADGNNIVRLGTTPSFDGVLPSLGADPQHLFLVLPGIAEDLAQELARDQDARLVVDVSMGLAQDRHVVAESHVGLAVARLGRVRAPNGMLAIEVAVEERRVARPLAQAVRHVRQ